MEAFKGNILPLAIFAIAVVLFSSPQSLVVGQVCQGDMPGLITQCAQYVRKGAPRTNPSPECCKVIETVDIPCVCQRITGEVEQIIDMEKVVFVAKSCARPLAPGSKCGSYTVPP